MKLLNSDQQEIKEINLLELEAGENKEFIYYLYNDTEAEVFDISLELIPKSKEYEKSLKEINIVSLPKTIAPEEKAKFKLKWTATFSVKKGIRADIKISSKELYS